MWEQVGGSGVISFARTGTMVVYGQESLHHDVLKLLETYRAALRVSKPRDQEAIDPNEVVTVYYRLHSQVAKGLKTVLPQLVRPDSWKIAGRPDLPGEIIFTPSVPELDNASAKVRRTSTGDDSSAVVEEFASRAVLIIWQTRAAHDEIAKVIQRVQNGDDVDNGNGQGGGGGFGGGGFGGGFFSTLPDVSDEVE